MKRVAFLDYSPIFAGAERVLYNVITHLDRTKYQPILLFPYPMPHQQRYFALDCEKVYLADSKKWWMGSDRWEHPLKGTDFVKRAEFGRRICCFVKEWKIDIVDVNLMRKDVMMWVWATQKFTDAKIVGHYRSQSQSWVAPGKAQKLFDVIACVSEFSRMCFRLKGDFTKTVVLYDSVDVDVMKSNLTKQKAKQLLGYQEDDILLTSIGQLSLRKGHDTAIMAFSKIANEFPNARLLIAGGGGNATAEYYRDLAKKYGVTDLVNIPGKQFSNVQSIYRATDLTLSLTKDGEGFGLVPYESTLIGTPFIAPCFGAVCEFVKDGENGLLVDTNDVEAVAEKIRYALRHPVETKLMIESLQNTIHKELHPEVLANNLDLLYSSL